MYIKRDTKYFFYLYILDISAMWISFFTAFYIRFFSLTSVPPIYLRLLTVLTVCTLLADMLSKNLYGFFERGYLKECIASAKCTFTIWVCFLLYSFILKETSVYSRLFIISFFLLSFFVTYLLRILFKRYMNQYYRKGKNGSKVAIVTTSSFLYSLTENFSSSDAHDYWISHIAIVDENRVGETVNGFTVTLNAENLFDVLRTEVIDEAFIFLPPHDHTLSYYISGFQAMGTTVHIAMESLNFYLPNVRVEKLIGNFVLTTSENAISHFQLMQKRALDLVGATVGLLLTAVASIVLIPAICIESKGAPIYSQIRIGRNGRQFKMYKFRSMYQDADARKEALVAQNEMSGLMFKIKDDPRITKVGKFIRKTSLDELPQFWNVLIGDMSLVGTRPPTLDEFEQYSLHHKSRLSFKPGITGLWQISGRNDITDFEDVVSLDTKYIENWSFYWDIKILCHTLLHILKGKGAS